MTLRFLYVGCKELRREIEFQTQVLGHRLKWWFERFGAQVASLDSGSGPELLLATHLEVGICLWIYEVEDLAKAKKALQAGGAKLGTSLEIPNGPCQRFSTASGFEGAIFEDQRKGAMEAAYADPENPARRFL